jgi:hypothetical protein
MLHGLEARHAVIDENRILPAGSVQYHIRKCRYQWTGVRLLRSMEGALTSKQRVVWRSWRRHILQWHCIYYVVSHLLEAPLIVFSVK